MAIENQPNVGRTSRTREEEESESALPIDPSEALETVSQWARENPHAALAAAAGVGFLLGGGLTPRMLGAVGLMAARYYFKQAIGGTLEQVLPQEQRR